MIMPKKNIQVAIRVRPLNKNEILKNETSKWIVDGKNISTNLRRPSNTFTFDHVFDVHASNDDIYCSVFKNLVASVMQGFNATIFAYGQTSSGKTHTILGSTTEAGLLERAVDDIFSNIRQNAQKRFLLRISYLEIYNEKVNDLLAPSVPVVIKQIANIPVIKAHEEMVTDSRNVMEFVRKGNKNRQIGETKENKQSSRSHALFRIDCTNGINIIESTDSTEVQDTTPIQVSRLDLVDLAGSERVEHTKATGTRLKEGNHINQSLSTLSLAIRQLSEGERYICFRNSKLTRILQESLGGNSMTLIIAAINPTSVDHSYSTLMFAQTAKVVKNSPLINQEFTEKAVIKKYVQEINMLKNKLHIAYSMTEDITRKNNEENRSLKNRIHYLEKNFISSSTMISSHHRHTTGVPISKTSTSRLPVNRMLTPVMNSSGRRHMPPMAGMIFKQPTLETVEEQEPENLEEIPEREMESDVGLVTDVSISPDTSSTPKSLLRERLLQVERQLNELEEFTKIEKDIETNESVESLRKQLQEMSIKLTFQTAQYNTLLNEYNNGVAKLKNSAEEINRLGAENHLLVSKTAEAPNLAQKEAQQIESELQSSALINECNQINTAVSELNKSRQNNYNTHSSNEEMTALRSRLQESQTKFSILENKYITLNQTSNIQDVNLEQMNLAIAERDATISELSKDLHEQRLISKKVIETSNKQEDELKTLQSLNSTITKEVKLANKANSQQDLEMKSLLEAHQKIELENISLQQVLNSLKHTKEELEDKYAEYEIERHNLIQEIEASKNNNLTQKALKGKDALIAKQQQFLTNLEREFTSKLESLAQCAECFQYKSKMLILTNNSLNYENLLKNKQDEINNLKDQVTRADIESQDKTYLINNLESVKENLDNKVVGFEETLENRDKSYAESLEKIKALENQINGLVAQNSERTRNEQDFWQTKILNYIKKVSDLEGTIQKSDEKLETRNTEIKACKHNFEQAQQEITRLTKNSADTHNKQCSEKEELIKREQNEVKLAEAERKILEKTNLVEKLETNNKYLDIKNACLGKELEIRNKEVAEKLNEIKTLENHRKESEQVVENLQKTTTREQDIMQTKIQNYITNISLLESILKASEENNRAKNIEINQLHDIINKTEKEHGQACTTCTELELKLQAMEAKVEPNRKYGEYEKARTTSSESRRTQHNVMFDSTRTNLNCQRCSKYVTEIDEYKKKLLAQSIRLSELHNKVASLEGQVDEAATQYYSLRVKNLESELNKLRTQSCSACASRSDTSEKGIQVTPIHMSFASYATDNAVQKNLEMELKMVKHLARSRGHKIQQLERQLKVPSTQGSRSVEESEHYNNII